MIALFLAGTLQVHIRGRVWVSVVGPAAERKLETPAPRFPEGAGEGMVRVLFRVGRDGRVVWKKLLESSGKEALDASALEAVSRWRFSPGPAVESEARFWFGVKHKPPKRFHQLPKPETVRVVSKTQGKAVKKKTKLKLTFYPKGKVKVLKKVKPQHPGFPCEVALRAELAPPGEITRVEVVKSSGYPEVDSAAVEAVKSWRVRAKAEGYLKVKFTFEVEESPVLEEKGP